MAREIAYEAGRIMHRYFEGDQGLTIKDDGTPLTVADTLINRHVVECLQAVFPADRIIGEEESVGEYGMGRVWFCDPIDGTKAYTWGVPTSMFSLALVIDGQPVIGVTYDPFLDRLFEAEAGAGSTCNGAKLNAGSLALGEGIVAITSSPKDIMDYPTLARLLMEQGSRLAVYSGAVHKAMAVASGRFVGFVETKGNAYDLAAAQVIVEEAGGAVTMLDGSRCDYTKPFRGGVVSNGQIHLELLSMVERAMRH